MDYLEKLLPILRAHGVTHYKNSEIELTLSLKESAQDLGTAPLIEALKKQEESLPPDFRADDLMNESKVMFYSAPDNQDEAMPLTEELEL